MKVSIVGVSGIGRFHGQWFSKLGHEVVSFFTRDSNKIEGLSENLRDLFGFSGQGYSDYKEMLDSEKPDIVVVSSPAETHYRYVLDALNSESNVFCEKPVVWSFEENEDQNIARSLEIARKASDSGRIFRVNTQYRGILPMYFSLIDQEIKHPKEFYFEMDTKVSDERGFGKYLYSEIMPHPLSILLEIFPNLEFRIRNLRRKISKEELNISFTYSTKEGDCKVNIRGRNNQTGNLSRKFGLEGMVCDISGTKGDDGEYKTKLSYRDREIIGDDLMKQSVSRFCSDIEENKSSVDPLDTKNVELQAKLYFMEEDK